MARDRGAAPTPAVVAARAAGIGHALHQYVHDPATASYGEEAAEALGVEPERVFKTLVCRHVGGPVVGMVPVSAMLDLKALAAAVGAKRVDLADPAEAERLTGYVVGAISPLGQRRRLPTVLDESALVWPTILCSAGRRGLELELAPQDLVRALGATTAPVACH